MGLLQKRLKEKMRAQGLSAHSLEQQAGLRASAVQNILSGRSKSPGIDTIAAIAKILECPIDALIKEEESFKSSSVASSHPWNGRLYSLSLELILKLFKTKGAPLSKEMALKYAEEVYAYSLNANRKVPDKSFAKWIVEKSL